MIHINDTIICDEIEGGAALLDPVKENIVILNEQDYFVLKAARVMKMDELIKHVLSRYQGDAETIERDIINYFQKLAENEFITILKE